MLTSRQEAINSMCLCGHKVHLQNKIGFLFSNHTCLKKNLSVSLLITFTSHCPPEVASQFDIKDYNEHMWKRSYYSFSLQWTERQANGWYDPLDRNTISIWHIRYTYNTDECHTIYLLWNCFGNSHGKVMQSLQENFIGIFFRTLLDNQKHRNLSKRWCLYCNLFRNSQGKFFYVRFLDYVLSTTLRHITGMAKHVSIYYLSFTCLFKGLCQLKCLLMEWSLKYSSLLV